MPAHLSCEKVLADASAQAMFLTFAKAEFSEENLEFWIAVSEFHRKWDAGEDKTSLLEGMFTEYLNPGSLKQVCIGDSKVNALKAKMKEANVATLKGLFDDAQEIALKTLKEDIFPRFEEHTDGQALLGAGTHNQ